MPGSISPGPSSPQVPSATYTAGSIGTGLFTTDDPDQGSTHTITLDKSVIGAHSVTTLSLVGSQIVFVQGTQKSQFVIGVASDDGSDNIAMSVAPVLGSAAWSGTYSVSFVPPSLLAGIPANIAVNSVGDGETAGNFVIGIDGDDNPIYGPALVFANGNPFNDAFFDSLGHARRAVSSVAADTAVSATLSSNTTYATNSPRIVATGDLLAQSAAQSSVATYTTPDDSTDHNFRVNAYATITAISAGTLTVQVTFTDQNGASRTITYFAMGLTSAGLTATGYTAFAPVMISCSPNAPITLKTLFTGVSITYDIGGVIESLYQG